jgi:hypothetical protein
VFSGLTGWHLIMLLLSLAPLVLWIVALVQIAASKATGGTIALWIVIVTLFPLIGAIVWFAVGRRTATQNIPAVPVRPLPGVVSHSDGPHAEPYAAPRQPAAPMPAKESGADVPPPSAPAGWYPSPSHSGLRQWWDGSQWRAHLESGPPTQ